jgi:4-hydroxybenzoate polyprenyltransferase
VNCDLRRLALFTVYPRIAVHAHWNRDDYCFSRAPRGTFHLVMVDNSVPENSVLRGSGRGKVWLFALARSGLLTAASAAALIGVVAVASRCPLSWVGTVYGAAMTFAGYGIDRIYDARSGERRVWMSPLSVVVALVFLSAVGLALATQHWCLALAAPLFPIGVLLYCVPWRPAAKGWRSFKELPYLKMFYVAFFWWLLSVLPSLPPSFARPSTAQLVVWSYVIVRIACAVVASDIKDIAADRAAGIVTFPTRFGAARCVRGMQIAHVALLVMVGAAVFTSVLPKSLLAVSVDALGSQPLLELLRFPDAAAGIVSDVLLEAVMALTLPALLLARLVM